MDIVRSLDAFPKMKAEDTVRTTHGACASIIAFTLMAFLFVSEYSFYSTIEVSDRLTVNSTHGEHLKVCQLCSFTASISESHQYATLGLQVSFDILFPHIPCDIISLDALDTSGQKQVLAATLSMRSAGLQCP